MKQSIQTKFKNPEVYAVFQDYPQEIKIKLLSLRQMIFDVARNINKVGELEETLKWGQPSYLTSESKSGTTIRIDRVKSDKYDYAMYFNCQTSLVYTFREIFGDEFRYEGNRAILFRLKDKISTQKLKLCISMALTYHIDKKKSR
jgi:hypothetical protein